MRNISSLVFALLSILFSCSAYAFFAPEAKITIKVVDEKGLPMEDVKVGTGFRLPDFKRGGITGTREEGYTEKNGNFEASARTIDQIGYSVSKDGYYTSRCIYKVTDYKNDKWLPWNPTVELVLRKIENPVSYFRTFETIEN